eukprot:gene12527-14488_t
MCFTGIITTEFLNAMVLFELMSEDLPEAALIAAPNLRNGQLRALVTDVHLTAKALFEVTGDLVYRNFGFNVQPPSAFNAYVMPGGYVYRMNTTNTARAEMKEHVIPYILEHPALFNDPEDLRDRFNTMYATLQVFQNNYTAFMLHYRLIGRSAVIVPLDQEDV